MGSNIELGNFELEKVVELIMEASVRLKCTIRTRCKALLIYHHFKRCVQDAEYDSHLVSAACISLSSKSNEEDIDFEAIVMTFYYLNKGCRVSTLDRKFKSIKRSVTMIELVILRMIEFQLNYVLIHDFLVYFLNDLREDLTRDTLWEPTVETCMKISSDFYLSNKCLNYKAEEIAVSVVQAAFYLEGMRIDDVPFLSGWMKNLKNVDMSKRQDILEDIYKICQIGPVAESHKSRS